LRPVVKATALKFVFTFRNQFTQAQLVALMPMLIAQLSSPSVPVHTLAALAIERILVTKEDIQGTSKATKFKNTDLKPVLESLFTTLFGIVDNESLNENDYVMKCVMRALAVAQEDVVPITQILIEKLTTALARVSKNPRNPQFNHYLFESVAVLVRSVCAKNPSATPALENLLFPPFQTVLQMEVLELSPYVFQILAQLLEFRSVENGLGQYEGLFRPLLTPTLWERKGDIPALTRLVQAYLMKAAPMLVNGGHLVGILGCFQKLLSSPSTEADAFNLLNALVLYVPLETMKQYNGTIFQLLLTKLQSTKSSKSEHRFQKFAKLVVHFFALFVGKWGSSEFFAQLSGIQQGLAISLIVQVWLPKLQNDPPRGMDAKIQMAGLTKLLCETPSLFEDVNGQQLWCGIFLSLSTLLSSPAATLETELDGEGLFAADVQYDSAYSGLSFAKKQVVDPFPEVADPVATFSMALQDLSNKNPGRLVPLVQESLKNDPKLAQGMESLFQKSGVRLA
jgi:exportin-2 (importin alpha re-exporter)